MKWHCFCEENNFDIWLVSGKGLTEPYQAGAQYETLNSTRVTLSLLCNNELFANAELHRLRPLMSQDSVKRGTLI